MANLTFVSLFESEQEQLKSALQGCSLPKDAQKLQTIVAEYMSKLFDSDGELRMNLTQSEDYILQAAISLLNAQQKMATTMSDSMSSTMKSASETTSSSRTDAIGMAAVSGSASIPMSLMSRKISAPSAIGGSALGSIGGGLLFGTWGAVFGAIAGTALVLYVSATTTEKSTKTTKSQTFSQTAGPIEPPIDVDQYLAIIRNICQSLDSLIETFRAQIRRVAQNYESVKEQSLEDDFSDLLENIQSLIGVCDNPTTSTIPSKIASKIEDIEDALEGYGLTIVRYNEESKKYFIPVSSPNVTELVVATPAILKDGKVIIKGKIFIPTEK